MSEQRADRTDVPYPVDEVALLKARVADLEHRLERADHHLRLRTSALTRVLARERRERAIVVGTTAYFPGRIRQIVEEHHRRGW